MNFEQQYQFKNTDLIFTIFKSGDLRDDSGFYFSAGNFKGLLTVDANNLNFLKLTHQAMEGRIQKSVASWRRGDSFPGKALPIFTKNRNKWNGYKYWVDDLVF